MTRSHKRQKYKEKDTPVLSIVDLTVYLENQHNQQKSIITKVEFSKCHIAVVSIK